MPFLLLVAGGGALFYAWVVYALACDDEFTSTCRQHEDEATVQLILAGGAFIATAIVAWHVARDRLRPTRRWFAVGLFLWLPWVVVAGEAGAW